MFQKIKKTKFPPDTKPIFMWDGTCGFCKYWVTRWKLKTKDTIAYKTYQEAHKAFPDIPLKEFKKASRLIEPDGSVYSGPDSAYRCYTYSDSLKINMHKWYTNSRSFQHLSDHGYNFIAKNRPFMFKLTKLLLGSDPTHFKPYWLYYIITIILLVFIIFQ